MATGKKKVVESQAENLAETVERPAVIPPEAIPPEVEAEDVEIESEPAAPVVVFSKTVSGVGIQVESTPLGAVATLAHGGQMVSLTAPQLVAVVHVFGLAGLGHADALRAAIQDGFAAAGETIKL